MYLPNLTFVALPVPDIIRGYSKNLGSLWIRPCSLFSQIFKGLLLGWTFLMYRPNLQSVALAVPEIIAMWVGLRTSILGKGRSGMVPLERALVTSYRPSTVTFPLSLRVSEILPLLCSSTPLFPTPLLVSPKFPHVSLGGWPLGYEK